MQGGVRGIASLIKPPTTGIPTSKQVQNSFSWVEWLCQFLSPTLVGPNLQCAKLKLQQS